MESAAAEGQTMSGSETNKRLGFGKALLALGAAVAGRLHGVEPGSADRT